MYTPSAFAESEGHVLVQCMMDHPFATIVCADSSGALHLTHAPVTVTTGPAGVRVAGHFARQNPHWRLFDGAREVVVVFHGPHAYVSPRWYDTPSVPTWNYAAVHAYGMPTVTQTPAELERDVRALVGRFERGVDAIDPDQLMARARAQLAGVVGFSMVVSRLEGKFKLNQNRSSADQARVASALLASDRCEDRACGALMRDRQHPPFTVVRATPDDAAGVLHCLHRAFAPFRAHYTAAAYENTVLNPESVQERLAAMTVLVARDRSGSVIGAVGGHVVEADGHLRGMAVLPEWQGRGVANALLIAMELQLAGQCASLTLDSTAPLERARRFYERHGYRQSGLVGDFHGMPLFQYVKGD